MITARPASSLGPELVDANVSHGSLAEDMAGFAARVRALLELDTGRSTRVPLGGDLFDVVITGGGAEGHAVAVMMDEIQQGCGPVIDDPGSRWLYWLVPPGSAEAWQPHDQAVCVGDPHTITLPALSRLTSPGPYWLRPCASDRIVPTKPLRRAVDRCRPVAAPHSALSLHLGSLTR
ncbi:hypothetical protein ACFYVW_18640 [Streptomyces tendae]|uniref:hypothetical protein n=1 Tax=Streptomyces tendae TaxID=1932 RepID=UPI0036C2821E